MCESNVFVVKDGRKEQAMKDVVRVEAGKDITVYDILGNSEHIKGVSIEYIDFLKHEIVLVYNKSR